MSLAHTAEYLKKHGRGPDDQLVHMSSKELKGLQAVAMAHGGSLTVNPNTGLPEAGFLDSILPMVLGAGLAMIPGVGPLAAAGMVGAGYGIAKKDLNAGLMAGLGAYGGAGLASGLGAAGAEAAAKTAGETAATNFANAPNTAGSMVEGLGGAGEVARESASNFINPQNFPNLSADQLANMQVSPTAETIRSAGMVNQIQAPQTTMGNLGNTGRGLGALGSGAGRSAFYAGMPTGTLPATLLSASNVLTPQTVPNQLGSPDSNPMGFAKLSPDFKGYEPEQPNPYYKAQYADYAKNPYSYRQMASGGLTDNGTVEQMSRNNALGGNQMFPQSGIGSLTGANRFQNATNTPMGSEVVMPTDHDTQRGFAKGGHLSRSASIPDTGIFYDSDLTTKNLPSWNASQAKYKQIAKRSNTKSADLPKTGIEKLGGDFSDAGASGGIATLGSYSDGGRLLKGPGDGMSDDIPAQIGKHQPARLADGEFVVPADVVSHLGNGSTDAGAKKLYSMMDNIRKARTGRKAQGKQVNANKFLPKA